MQNISPLPRPKNSDKQKDYGGVDNTFDKNPERINTIFSNEIKLWKTQHLDI